MKKNLIVAVCGDESLHKVWMNGCPNFDLFVVYYGDLVDKYKYDGKYYEKENGTKFNILNKVIKKYENIFENYEAVLVPDDDLYATASDWNRFFQLFHQYRLELAQPSIFGWQSNRESGNHPDYILRYTNWVEIMSPCFSKSCLQKIKHTFGFNETDWGIDYIWIKLLGYPQNKIAIIDDVIALHTRPCFYGDTYWRNKNNFDKAVLEIRKIGEDNDINLDNIIVYGGVKQQRETFSNLPSNNKFLPANCDILKSLIKDLRKKLTVESYLDIDKKSETFNERFFI